jgi:hypothetical protein
MPSATTATSTSTVHETACHAIEIEIKNSGVKLVRQRGLVYYGKVRRIPSPGIELCTHEFYCPKCSKVLSFQEAREASTIGIDGL